MFKLVLPIILIITSGGLFFSYVDPSYKEIKDLKEVDSQYDEALNKSKELREVRDELLSKYNTFDTEDVEKLEKLLPDHFDNVRLIMDIDNIASRYNVLIRKVDVIAGDSSENALGKNTDGFNTMSLDFVIEASYEDFQKFLEDLTNSLRLVDVVDLSFQSSNLSLYRYKLNIKTYWLK